MTGEQLTKGLALKEQIDRLKPELEDLNKANQLYTRGKLAVGPYTIEVAATSIKQVIDLEYQSKAEELAALEEQFKAL